MYIRTNELINNRHQW